MADAKPKKPKCTRPRGHPYEPGHPDCELDQAQFEREGRRRQTTVQQREMMRQALHQGANAATMDELEDDADAEEVA